MSTIEIGFLDGNRKEAIEQAIEMVRENGRPAEVIVCRDIPGKHTAGEDCFCDPKILVIDPEDLK
jgi:hypothetical protein